MGRGTLGLLLVASLVGGIAGFLATAGRISAQEGDGVTSHERTPQLCNTDDLEP